jgi:hypothetical protein
MDSIMVKFMTKFTICSIVALSIGALNSASAHAQCEWNGFGNLADGRPFWGSDFAGDVRADLLFYTPADANWWLGRFGATDQLAWALAGNTAGFGDLADGRPFWSGNFSGDARSEILFYTPADSNWWLGHFDAYDQLGWSLSGNTTGFGGLADGRPFWSGDFAGDAKADILFYTPADANWWLGQFDAYSQLGWSLAGNTAGFGDLADGRPFWSGDFTGDAKADILFYTPADANWWLGRFDASGQLGWSLAGNTAGFGDLADGRPFWSGDFAGDGKSDILFYTPADSNWWLGQFDASGQLTWTLSGNTAGFGGLADGRPFWSGDFVGDAKSDILFYTPNDYNWWLGRFDASSQLVWSYAGNTAGFGDLADGRPFWSANFTADSKQDVTFYYPGDGNWWLGAVDGTGYLTWSLAGNTGYCAPPPPPPPPEPPPPPPPKCPPGCAESNVACVGFVLFNTCWCPGPNGHCPEGGWWPAGACIGGWVNQCIGP